LNVAGTAGNDIINGGSDNDTLGGKNEVWWIQRWHW
jgi:Ca2+-binding RTX toxin-like protein